MNVLVAGGAGYIGSHTVKRLKATGHRPVIYDNCSRGHREVIDILGVPAVVADLGDRSTLLETLQRHEIDTVMHFAAYAYVGESVTRPLMYYRNNVAATVSLLGCMQDAGVSRFVFSSSCATYGDPARIPVTEGEPTVPVSPYGRSKLMIEQVLRDVLAADPTFAFAALRYFNAAGCSLDGTLGEDHVPEPHLIPSAIEAALGSRPALTIHGTDYPTPDGTPIRDYVHVDDLADAHLLAMDRLTPGRALVCNLGTGQGSSVREVIATVEEVAGRTVPIVHGPRRAGDAAALYADPTRARHELGWEAKHSTPATIVRSAWAWHSTHPRGYRT